MYMVLKRVKRCARELLSKYLDHIFFICVSYVLIHFLFTIFPVVVTKQMYVFYVGVSLDIENSYWTRAIKRFALFDLLKSLYSDTNILSKYIPSLPKKL